MKLFGFLKNWKEAEFHITPADRAWVEDNFKWLLRVYGCAGMRKEQVLINESFFPNSFKSEKPGPESIIRDISQLLSLDPGKISYELLEDIRDSYGTPYEIHDKPFECETAMGEGEYKIFISKSLLQHPHRLIYSLLYEFMKIRLHESKLAYDTGEDTSLFIYIAGIYFGFGLPLSQQLIASGREPDGFWETKWHYVSEMPVPVMAFGLVLYAGLLQQESPAWIAQLPSTLKKEFQSAMKYLRNSPSQLLNENELAVMQLFYQADQEYQGNQFDAGISTLQKILFLATDELVQAEVYNAIAYNQIRLGEYEKSISSFRKAIELDQDYGFAYDNLGYALIMTGDLEQSRLNIENAIATEQNDPAYSCRNLALYHAKMNEPASARVYFQKAFDEMTVPVDLLEFHYAQFLLKNGEKEKGFEYLQKAVNKHEPEAIQLMKEYKGN